MGAFGNLDDFNSPHTPDEKPVGGEGQNALEAGHDEFLKSLAPRVDVPQQERGFLLDRHMSGCVV